MKEIGGPFEFPVWFCHDQTPASLFDLKDYHSFHASGRDCLTHIVNYLDGGRILLPAYLCESVYRPFANAKHLEIVWVPVLEGLQLDYDFICEHLEGTSGILIIDYFGQRDDKLKEIFLLAAGLKVPIIHDKSHSWLHQPLAWESLSDFTVISLRKVLPIPDGALLTSRVCLDLPEESNSILSHLKLGAMVFKRLGLWKCLWYQLFRFHETCIDKGKFKFMSISLVSLFLIHSLDIEFIRKRRQANSAYLAAHLAPHLALFPQDRKPLLAFPILLESKEVRDALHSHLIGLKIYCPIHWKLPSGLYWSQDQSFSCGKETDIHCHTAKQISDRILSVPIDHRYTPADLDRVVVAIKSFLG